MKICGFIFVDWPQLETDLFHFLIDFMRVYNFVSIKIILTEIIVNLNPINKNNQRLNDSVWIRQFLLCFRIETFKKMAGVLNLTESQVLELLDWPLVFNAVEQALRSICKTKVGDDQPTAVQPTRIFTPTEKGIDVVTSVVNYHSVYKIIIQNVKWNIWNCKLQFFCNLKWPNCKMVEQLYKSLKN